MEGVVIAGGGQAGAQLAVSLRELGYTSPVKLIADEQHLPYNRPPLSKAYLAGDLPDSELPIRSPEFYRSLDIALVTGVPASSINRETQTLSLEDGRLFPYEHLVIATGARNRRLAFEGGEPSNVRYLRTWDDAKLLRDALGTARNVLIVGAGFIGLEFASACVVAGKRTTVVEMAPRVMGRAVSKELSEYFADRHRTAGADVLCGTAVDEFIRDDSGDVVAVQIAGQTLPTDLVVVGIGVIPNTELAERAGLVVEDGIIVDSTLRTADPAIFAIGDCARFPRPDTAGPVRVESVQNAADQARYVARHITSTTDVYDDTPWFWSHQAGHKLQIAGLAMPTDKAIIIGDPASGSFSVARTREGRMVAVESVNAPGDHLASRKLLSAARAAIREDQLHDPEFSFRAAVRPPARAKVPAHSLTHI